MSCVFALVLPDVSLVADTRINMPVLGGPTLINDEGVYEITRPDGNPLESLPLIRHLMAASDPGS
jgi:hypothetical protein